MTQPDYDTLYDRACTRKGGEAAVEGLLPQIASQRHLEQLGSDRYLAEFTRKIFQSGFVWRVVDKKWKDFEHVFWQFDIERLLMMPDDMLERKAQDPAIIRNFSKIKTIRENAMMITDTERREGRSFGEFISQWPKTMWWGCGVISKKTAVDSVAIRGPTRCAR
jgi:3-methyladenine DNA glycosylase Tag